MGRRRGSLFGPLALVLVLFAGTASPAGAHGDDGAMDVLSSKQAGPNSIYLEVSIPYAGDGELASTAAVTATLTGPEDEVIENVPLALTAQSSYTGEIRVPRSGTWIVSLASVNPVSEATVEVRVVGAGGNAPEAPGPGPLVPAAIGVTALVVASAAQQRRRVRRPAQ